MKIFKELKKLGYIHYSATTIEELDNLPLNSAERVSEQALVLRWFREKYGLDAEIGKNDKEMIDYVASKGETYLPKYRYGYTFDNYVSVGACMKYEEAELACLKKLIQIVKENKQ